MAGGAPDAGHGNGVRRTSKPEGYIAGSAGPISAVTERLFART